MTGFGTAVGKAQPLSVSDPAATAAELIASAFAEDLLVAAAHAGLEEDQALALLRRNDLPPRLLRLWLEIRLRVGAGRHC